MGIFPLQTNEYNNKICSNIYVQLTLVICLRLESADLWNPSKSEHTCANGKNQRENKSLIQTNFGWNIYATEILMGGRRVCFQQKKMENSISNSVIPKIHSKNSNYFWF